MIYKYEIKEIKCQYNMNFMMMSVLDWGSDSFKFIFYPLSWTQSLEESVQYSRL